MARTIIGRDGMLIRIKGRILKYDFSGVKKSHYMVDLCREGNHKKHLIHKLVAQHFNRVDNLQIITQQKNVQKSRDIKGARNHVRTRIRLIDVENNEEFIFDNCERATEFVGVQGRTIINHADRISKGIVKGKYEVLRIS